jgi:ribosomal protein L29
MDKDVDELRSSVYELRREMNELKREINRLRAQTRARTSGPSQKINK